MPRNRSSSMPGAPRLRVAVVVVLSLLAMLISAPPALSQAAPPNDERDGAIALEGIPTSVEVDLSGATLGADDPDSPCLYGDEASLWYRVEPSEDVETVLDVSISPVPGTAVVLQEVGGGLSEVACADSQGMRGSQTVVHLVGGQTYYVLAGVWDGYGTEFAFTFRDWAPPANDERSDATLIDALPFEADVAVGDASPAPDDPSSECLEGHEPTVWYRFDPADDLYVRLDVRWSPLDGGVVVLRDVDGALSEVACAQQGSYTGPPDQALFDLEAGGSYYLVVGGRDGSGSTFSFYLDDLYPPDNDERDNATVIDTLPFSPDVDLRDATVAADDPDSYCVPFDDPTVWYRYEPSEDISVVLDVSASPTPGTVVVFQEHDGSLSQVACAEPEDWGSPIVSMDLEAGGRYAIMVAAVPFDPELDFSFTLRPTMPPANDARGGAVAMEPVAAPDGTLFRAEAALAEASRAPDDPTCDGDVIGHTVWFAFDAPADRRYQIRTSGGTHLNPVGVYREDGADLVEVACGTSGWGGTVRADFVAERDERYLAVVGTPASAPGADATVTLLEQPPPDDEVTETVAATLPYEVGRPGAVFDGTRILLLGGDVEGNPGLQTDQVMAFDPQTSQGTVLDGRLPRQQSWMGTIWDGEAAYTFGGWRLGGATDGIYRFDPTTGASSLAGVLPWPRFGAAAVYDGSAAYVFGGRTGRLGGAVPPQVVKFDPASGEVTLLDAVVPEAGTANNAAASAGDVAYVVNGRSIARFDYATETMTTMEARLPSSQVRSAAFDGRYLWIVEPGRTWRYDPDTDTLTEQGPTAGSGAAAVFDGEHLYVVGDDRVIRYDPDTDTSTFLGVAPGAGAALHGKHALVLGPRGQIARFHTVRERVEVLEARLPHAPFRPGAAAVGGLVYLFGGDGSATDDPVGKAILRVTRSGQVKELDAKLPVARGEVTAVPHGRYVYLLGGREAGGPFEGAADILRYDPRRDTVETMDATLSDTGITDLDPGLTAVSVGSQILIFGAHDHGSFPDSNVEPVLAYDPDSDTVTEMGSTPRLSNPLAFADDDRVVVVGDFWFDEGRGRAAAYDLASGTTEMLYAALPTVASVSSGSDHMSGVFDGHDVWLFSPATSTRVLRFHPPG